MSGGRAWEARHPPLGGKGPTPPAELQFGLSCRFPGEVFGKEIVGAMVGCPDTVPVPTSPWTWNQTCSSPLPQPPFPFTSSAPSPAGGCEAEWATRSQEHVQLSPVLGPVGHCGWTWAHPGGRAAHPYF